MYQVSHPQVTKEMQDCITNCQDCHSTCVETAEYCLQKGGQYVEEPFVRLLLDCAQLCQTSADCLLRGSTLYSQVCGLCADVCEQCARECDRFGGDASIKACGDLCRQCASSCHQMSGGKSIRKAA